MNTSPAEALKAAESIALKKKQEKKKPKLKIVERPFGLPDPVLGTPLYEQALVDGELCFIVVDEDGKIGFLREMEIKGGGGVKTVIRPRLDLPYKHYVVKREWLENPDSMLKEDSWNLGEKLLATYVDFLEPWHGPISMAAVVLSYFTDEFNSVSYLYALGDTDSGKSRWAVTVARLSYRAYYGESPPSADVYEFITHCGSTIVEDEAQGLERNREKLKLYKVGYQRGAKTMRIIINRNTGERRQVFYNAYGVKFFAGEEEVKDKGFMDRCIAMSFVKGHPTKDEFDPADDSTFEEVRGKLLAMRILAAAGKISINPYTCNQPWFEGRFKELYKPLLSVMPESKRQLILEAARERYEAKRAELTESIEAKCVLAYLEAVKANNGNPNQSAETIYEFLKPHIENIPEQYRPGLKSTGMKLTKLGFKSTRSYVDGKRVRIRYADQITLTKLVRKYDLAEDLEEKSLSLPMYSTPQPTEKTTHIHWRGWSGWSGCPIGETEVLSQKEAQNGEKKLTINAASETPKTSSIPEKKAETTESEAVGQPGQPGQPSQCIGHEREEAVKEQEKESLPNVCWLCSRLLPKPLKNVTTLDGRYVHLECYLQWKKGQRESEL